MSVQHRGEREDSKLENFLVYLTSVLGIVVIDLVLSGDNAIVIGMAAHRLPPRQRRLAVLFGGAGAILLRVLFAAIAALLLQVPLLQAVGGVVLLWIAWKLLRQEANDPHVRTSNSLFGALQTIILADVAMSLDNILAVAGVSHGNIALLLFGLALSMPLILVGSTVVASAIDRLPWLILVGSGVLAWTAGTMIVEDGVVTSFLHLDGAFHLLLPAILVVAVLAPTIREVLPLRRIVARVFGVK